MCRRRAYSTWSGRTRPAFDGSWVVLAVRDVAMRRLGTTEEVAEACLFLASNASSYVNGHNLVADGGYLTH